jgi:uncharacterized alkaline shock family protein YloU
MAEYKQYITQVLENGNVMIAEDVIASIITEAVSEVEGISGLAVKPVSEFADLIGMNWGKGMKITIGEDNTIAIDCNVVVKFGQSVIDVATNAQQAITAAVENVAGVKVTNVNVNICGIAR